MESWEYYLRNPDVSDDFIDICVENDCNVGLSIFGWTIIERRLAHTDKDGMMYIEIIIRDEIDTKIEEINETPLTKNGVLYQTCFAYYSYEVNSK